MQRKARRKCYDSIHDCQCNAGYTMNKHAERCEKIFVKPAPQPVPQLVSTFFGSHSGSHYCARCLCVVPGKRTQKGRFIVLGVAYAQR